ncbi:hypothetical protein GCM10009831_05960 [Dietzia cercidiphylli]|uniref:Uncharacterized protein n=1 Tax=Dietzia cercidiphylli TaxID=498199 RepID=A0ABN2I815_9ACTN
MRLSRPVVASAAALSAMAAIGVASGQVDSPDTAPVVVEATELAPAALPSLTFPVGVYTENRVSDQVTLPPGATLQFQGLPPGLTYDPRTTAIKGVPTTPGVYRPVATAYIGGIPVRTESTTVTITGRAGGGPAAPAPAPAPAAAPAPGTITIADIDRLPLPNEVKDALRGAAMAINDGIQAAWNTVPEGSLGK